MAQIVHTDGDVETVNHEGVDYKAGDHGIFDVPEEVAAKLVEWPVWSRFTGHKKAAADDAASADTSWLHERVAELRADVDKLLAAATDPAPKK